MDTEAAIAAFVGKKSGYYTDKWQQPDNDSPPALSFNTAAIILNIFWLAYRKLYAALFAVASVIALDATLSTYLEKSQLVPSLLIVAWDFVAPFVYAGVIGGFGNRWYWRKFQESLAKARHVSPDPALQEAWLEQRGGTSELSVWVLSVAAIGLVALFVFFADG